MDRYDFSFQRARKTHPTKRGTRKAVVCTFLLLLFALGACTKAEPLLTHDYLPESYQITEQQSSLENTYIIPLNQNLKQNEQLIRFWGQGSYTTLYKQSHPILPIKKSSLTGLHSFLNQSIDIYYLSPKPGESLNPSKVTANLDCDALSNLEIKFQMSHDPLHPFSEKNLTMLLISSHELLLQKGAIAIYPKILGKKLRELNQLPPLRPMEAFNLFADGSKKMQGEPPSSGIIVCRRKSS
ncbi:MAG: hypothetical protein COB67_10860 [SAR324 cluster bacterium]|uniref:Uncharacterized protein n=1 Tax=SAR324 cluster bacterium TaxID=2024889 RepID=A0A2A4SV06_9DELT|nr:MAG: hypothetical protein COB67_10860 [SAR324 cluster bacterium]